MGKVKKLLSALAQVPIYVLVSLLNRDPKIWIFSSWHGKKYSDNPRYLYEYCQSYEKNIKSIWLAKNKETVATLRSQGFNAYHTYSPLGILYQIKAGVCIFSHGSTTEFIPAFMNKKIKKIQLWHGSPIKKIRNDDNLEKKPTYIQKKILELLFPWRKERFDLIPSPSNTVKNTLASAFLSDNVYVCGYPRNDKLVPSLPKSGPILIKKVLYAPTFRGTFLTKESSESTSNLLLKSGFIPAEIDKTLQSIGLELILRLHPSNMPSEKLKSQIKETKNIKFDITDDIYESLNDYDILITDYSSIYLDFLLTGKPIINLAFDLDEYLTYSREMYYNYNEVAITKNIETWSSALSFIEDLLTYGPSEKYIKNYIHIRKKFNEIEDSHSSQRTSKLIHSLLLTD